MLLLAGCSIGQDQATPVAVNLPVYEPGAGITASTTLSAPVTAPDLGAATAPADDAQPAPATAAGESPTGRIVEDAEDAGGGQPDRAMANADSPQADAAVAPLLVATYAGEIVADERLVVVSEVNGQVMEVLVEVNDRVKAGDPLVRLDGTVFEAQRAQSLAGLRAAKAQLDQARIPADEEDLEAARAAVAAASAAYNRARSGPTEEDLRLGKAQLRQAEAAVAVAQAGYNLVRFLPEVGMMPQGFQLQQATLAYEAAQARYDALVKGATQDQVAAAYAQLAGAQAQLQRLEDGADPAQIRAAEAQVRAAENALYLAQLQIAKTTIAAPIDGAVAVVQTAAGALSAPGAPVVTLLSPLAKVTIDVEETRLSQLQVGQPALIRATAYPDQPIPGVVERIAPQLDAATRTVQVTIRPDDPDGLLAPGMSTQVELLDE
jgi:multidrug resistance efflux pump